MVKVIVYTGIDGEEEVAIECTVKDCLEWGGYGVCDLCGRSRLLDTRDPNACNDKLYLCPELGAKALCEKCFIEYKGRNKWHQEDFIFVINTLNLYIESYLPGMAQEEKNKLLKFIEKKKAQ